MTQMIQPGSYCINTSLGLISFKLNQPLQDGYRENFNGEHTYPVNSRFRYEQNWFVERRTLHQVTLVREAKTPLAPVWNVIWQLYDAKSIRLSYMEDKLFLFIDLAEGHSGCPEYLVSHTPNCSEIEEKES
jgi:hypothetical protein